MKKGNGELAWLLLLLQKVRSAVAESRERGEGPRATREQEKEQLTAINYQYSGWFLVTGQWAMRLAITNQSVVRHRTDYLLLFLVLPSSPTPAPGPLPASSRSCAEKIEEIGG